MNTINLGVRLPRPRPYQRDILTDPARFKLLLCGRRWGKTTLGLIAASQGHGLLPSSSTIKSDDQTPPAEPIAAATLPSPLVGERGAPRPGALQGARIGWVIPSEDHPAAAEVWSHLKKAVGRARLHRRASVATGASVASGALAALPDTSDALTTARVSEEHRRIDLPGGGSIQLWSGHDPDTLRGPYFDGLILDECSLLSRAAWEAVRPTLSDYAGWALLLGTVPHDVTRHWFADLHRRALTPDWRDRGWRTWRLPSWQNPQLSQPDLDEARETLGQRTFLREYGAELLTTDGGVWQEDWFRFYHQPPPPAAFHRIELFLDAAWRTGVRNDFSSCQAWGRIRPSSSTPDTHLTQPADFTHASGEAQTTRTTHAAGTVGAAHAARPGYYLLAELHGRWESPELRRRVAAFRETIAAQYPGHTVPLVVESAGGGLIAYQELRDAYPFPVLDFDVRGASKLARADAVTPLAEAGQVFLPSPDHAPWVRDWLAELVGFPQLPHDDRCDAAAMALQRLHAHVEPFHLALPPQPFSIDDLPF